MLQVCPGPIEGREGGQKRGNRSFKMMHAHLKNYLLLYLGGFPKCLNKKHYFASDFVVSPCQRVYKQN